MTNTLKRLKMNKEETEKYIEETRGLIEPKGCYNNAYHALNVIGDSEDYKMAIGYLAFDSNLAARHAFIVNTKENHVIDTSSLYFSTDRTADEYIVYKMYSLYEYVDMLEEVNKEFGAYYTDFRHMMMELRELEQHLLETEKLFCIS